MNPIYILVIITSLISLYLKSSNKPNKSNNRNLLYQKQFNHSIQFHIMPSSLAVIIEIYIPRFRVTFSNVIHIHPN